MAGGKLLQSYLHRWDVCGRPFRYFWPIGRWGGLIAVIDSGDGIGRATLFVKLSGTVSSREIFDISVGRLSEFDKKQEFVF